MTQPTSNHQYSADVSSVALIGVGAMGAPMARRIISAGYELTLFDTTPSALDPFRTLRVRIAEAPRDCAEVDVVLVVVATADQVRSVITSSQGLLAGVSASRRRPLVVVMSTIGTDASQDIHRLLAEAGISMIEAPISGGAARAEAGRLTALVGGRDDDVDFARPVLAAMANNLFHCGAVGSAQVVKIANNVIGNVNTLATAEVFRILQQLGLELSDVTPIFEVSSGRNWLSVDADGAVSAFAALTSVPFDATTSIIRKDISLAVKMASGVTGAFPMLEALASVAETLDGRTLETWQSVARGQG